MREKIANKYIPSKDDVKKLIEYAKSYNDGYFYIPLVLGIKGLRFSEIQNVRPSQIDNDILTIKEIKTNSQRAVSIPSDISEIIFGQGYAYNGNIDDIKDFIDGFCQKYNVKHFSFYALRKYFLNEVIESGAYNENKIAIYGNNLFNNPMQKNL